MTTKTNAAKGCFAVLLAMSLTACATQLGQTFDEGYATQIKPGETTKAQVSSKLGRAPLRRTSGDEETWTYAYYRGELGVSAMFGLAEPNLGTQKRLTIKFKGDVVEDSKFVVELPVD